MRSAHPSDSPDREHHIRRPLLVFGILYYTLRGRLRVELSVSGGLVAISAVRSPPGSTPGNGRKRRSRHPATPPAVAREIVEACFAHPVGSKVGQGYSP